MTVRIPLDPKKFGDVLGAMLGLNKVIESAGFDHKLLYLVEVRVSQLNGCGFCIDMHTKDARLEGETEQRLYLLNAWREAPIYSDRERAALAWAEAVTKLENGHVPDQVYQQAREHFDEQQLMKLTSHFRSTWVRPLKLSSGFVCVCPPNQRSMAFECAAR